MLEDVFMDSYTCDSTYEMENYDMAFANENLVATQI